MCILYVIYRIIVSPLLGRCNEIFKYLYFCKIFPTLKCQTKKDNSYIIKDKSSLHLSLKVKPTKLTRGKKKNPQTSWFSNCPLRYSKPLQQTDIDTKVYQLVGRSISTYDHAMFLSVMSYLCKAAFSVAAVIRRTVQKPAWNRK